MADPKPSSNFPGSMTPRSSIYASPTFRDYGTTFLTPSSIRRPPSKKDLALTVLPFEAWAGIHESDMLLKPDASCYLLDPFPEIPTLVLVCDVVDPVTKQSL